MLELFLITNDPGLASAAVAAGVGRVMVDTERLGKDERQEGRNMLASDHVLGDVSRLRAVLPPGTLMTRIDPLHAGTQAQVEEAIARGTDSIMLPMFRRAEEVASFVQFVGGRARVTLLLETVSAMRDLDRILQVPGIDDIHAGLNDLSLELGLPFLFQVVGQGYIDEIAAKVHAEHVRFGFGGVGRMDGQPLPGSMVIGEHQRVKSQMVILSRAFHGNSRNADELAAKGIDLRAEIARLRQQEAIAAARLPQDVERDRLAFRQLTQQIGAGATSVRA